MNLGHHPPHGRPVAIHLEREHRARRDLEREELHRHQHIHGPRSGGGEARNRRLGGACDVLREHGDDARRQGRCDGAALVPPFFTFAEDQPLADDGAQDSNGRRRPPVVRDIVDQHIVDRIVRIEQEPLAAEKGLDQDVLGVRLPRPNLERIGA